MEHLRCVVERITYHNPQNGFTVLQCRAKAYAELVTVVGSMPKVHAGSVLNIEGFWKVDAKYGPQFSLQAYEEALPATVLGMEKFLGGGLIKGIGPGLARRIVQTFGKDTLDILEGDIERLSEVEGIGKQRVELIRESWEEQKEVKNISLFLQSHDVSTVHITKIYKAYGKESIPLVKENPYRLADDIWGIGFKTADTIAKKLGFSHEAYERLRSGLLYTLNQLASEGHCYAIRQELLAKGEELLEVDSSLLGQALDKMAGAGDLITQELLAPSARDLAEGAIPSPAQSPSPCEAALYLPAFYAAEVGTAKRLRAISQNAQGFQLAEEGLLEKVQKETGLTFDQVQLQAISTAIRSKLLLLTGGPGTGKTTTTLGIIKAFQAAGARILLAAPTGRAAKRLGEATGMEAKTIHRLLDYKPPQGYQKNKEHPLEGDVLILDECSMIDLLLIYNLLKAVPDRLRIIFVGDVDQLPSVGAGNVLRDLMDSGCFPVVRLTRIFRQAQTSAIVLNAHRINQGQQPDLSNPPHTDFFFLDVERHVFKKGLDTRDNEVLARQALEMVCRYVKETLPKHYSISPQDIQVLVPMQRSLVGASHLNQVLQEKLNPSGPGLKAKGVIYRLGDKVMQIRNNYEKEVFNGDIGVISSVDEAGKVLTILFDGREVLFEESELDELVLAYATTIHKSQGSEYPIVVMPLLMNHFVMLQRNLVYTGITRAKRVLLLIGTRRALNYAIKNVTVTKRNTLLAQRLRSLLPDYHERPGKVLEKSQGQSPGQGPSPGTKPLSPPAPTRSGQVAETPLTYGKPSPDREPEPVQTCLADKLARAALKTSRQAAPLPPKEADQTSKEREKEREAAQTIQARQRAESSGEQAFSQGAPGGKDSGDNRPSIEPSPSIEPHPPRGRKPSKKEWMSSLFSRLQASTFRSRFHLKEEDVSYIQEKGLETIRCHAKDIVRQRLAPQEPKNDGHQTPMKGAPKGHPVFLAQHATATCCRGCLETWHHIPKGKELSPKTQEYVVDVIMCWIDGELSASSGKKPDA